MYSKFGRKLRVIDNYKFRFHKLLANDVEKWVCTQKQCNSAYLKIQDGQIIDEAHDHNHEPLPTSQLIRQKVMNGCKRRATEDIFDRPSKLIRRETRKEDLQVLNERDRDQIRKSIHGARMRVRPPLPHTLAELHDILASLDIRTKLDEQFLLVNDDVHNLVIFSTARNLDFLARSDALLMDGTFNTCPSLFKQLFILHGRKKHTYVPVAYCLLNGKTIENYQLTLQKIRSLLPSSYEPPIVSADFEHNIHVAVRAVWPSTTIEGCRFHLGQAWFRKIQALGLVAKYRSKSPAGSFLRTFFGMPFLPPELAEEFFLEDLMAYAPPGDKQIREFCEYVYDTYVCETARFPPSVWAKYSPRICRTTNACEGFHARLNGMFYYAHPDVHLLSDALLEIQERSYSKMLSVHFTKQRKRSSAKEASIQQFMDDYEDGKIHIIDYVKKVSRKFLPDNIRKGH